MESPIYTPSPIRSQTRFMTEMTRLRMQFEKELAQLYGAQAEYKAAYETIRLLVEYGAPDDLDISVIYGCETLVYFADESDCAIAGGLMDALLRSEMDYRIGTRSSDGQFVNINLTKHRRLVLRAKNEALFIREVV